MACVEGIDPADFAPGVTDPIDDPVTSEVSIQDAVAVRDPDGSRWVRFTVVVTTINFISAISVRWGTANGSALAGTHYVGQSNVLLTIPIGESEGVIAVPWLGSSSFTGTKDFFVNLSTPINCTIADSQGRGTIAYGSGGGGDPEPPPPVEAPEDLASHTGWAKPGVVYDQFADCAYKSACTGYAGAAVMSAIYRKSTGQEARFNAKKLFADAGGTVCNCVNCPGFSMVTVLKHMRDVGVKVMDADFDSGRPCFSRDIGSGFKKVTFSELGGSNVTKAELLKRIKRAIHSTGAVYMASIFYSNWNRCRAADNYILRPHGNESSTLAHAWVLTGWNNNKGDGCFEIQSSHGCDWGAGGRGWIPYSYLTTTWPGGNAVRYRYWKVSYAG